MPGVIQGHTTGNLNYMHNVYSEVFNDYVLNIATNGGHAEGFSTRANGSYSHAEGYWTLADGDYSHSEGYRTYAVGNIGHSEGDSTHASGEASHAEGVGTRATGSGSHTEGYYTYTTNSYANSLQPSTEKGQTGQYAHAEGYNTIASGDRSHAEGNCTKAYSADCHVEGRYNIADSEKKYIHIAGNGKYRLNTYDWVASNAYTLDWDGNGWYQGKLSQDGTPSEDNDLVTIAYLKNYISELEERISALENS